MVAGNPCSIYLRGTIPLAILEGVEGDIGFLKRGYRVIQGLGFRRREAYC